MKNNLKILIAAVLGILVINSCYKKDESNTLLQLNNGNDQAYLKFINTYTAPSPSANVPANGPSVNIFVNNIKINSGALSYAGSFPLSPAYAAVTPGLGVNIKVVLNRTSGTALASDTISNKNYNLGANSYTTFYVADTTPNPTPFNPFIIPIGDPTVTNAQVGFFRARFVNMIPSADTLEVFSRRLNAVIFKGVLYKNTSEGIEIPTFTTSDTLQLRKVSVPGTILASINGFNPTSSRVYTVYCTGNITGTPKTRVLTSYTNK